MWKLLFTLGCLAASVFGFGVPVETNKTRYDITEYHRNRDTILPVSVIVAQDALPFGDTWTKDTFSIVSQYFKNVIPIQIWPLYIQLDDTGTLISNSKIPLDLLKETRTIRKNTEHKHYAATFLLTVRSMNLQGIAYHDANGQDSLFCDNNNNPMDISAAVVTIEPGLQHFTASVIAHELGHLFGLFHDDGSIPNIMNSIAVGSNIFTQPSIDILELNLDVDTAKSCLRELPEVTITLPLSYNGNLYSREVFTIGLYMKTLTDGVKMFTEDFTCISDGNIYPIRILSYFYAECDIPSMSNDILNVNVAMFYTVPVNTYSYPIEQEPFFASWEWHDSKCTRIRVNGDGFAGKSIYFKGQFNSTLYVFPKVETGDTYQILSVPNIPFSVIDYAYIPGTPWKSTGLYFRKDSCSPIGPYRCSSTFTCSDNDLPDHCCSVAGWCGQTDIHCLAGNCINGPCCPKDTNCTGPWLPLEPFRCSDDVSCDENGLPDYCCSGANWCGTTSMHCGQGCKSGPCI